MVQSLRILLHEKSGIIRDSFGSKVINELEFPGSVVEKPGSEPG